MSIAILGLGTATPAQEILQTDAATMAAAIGGGCVVKTRLLPGLYRRTTVNKRASVLLDESGNGAERQRFFPPASGDEDRGPGTRERLRVYEAEAPGLAQRAALAALASSGEEPGAISHLITVSCTGFGAPGVDAALISGMGLRPTVARTHVGFMGCHGAINGLRVASAFGAAEPAARILLCAVELCSLHFHYGPDPEQMVANALFADGAAAVVLGAGGPEGAWRVAGTGSCLVPDSLDAMTWSIGNNGFEMSLSARVPGLIEERLRPWLETWLGSHGLTIGRVGSWAIHPGGPRVVGAAGSALGLPDSALEPSLRALAEHGNMSSPTVLFILSRLMAAGAARPCVVLGFGPGLVVEAALLR